MWFDEWVLKPGDSIPAKIEEGLERSRVLVLCMSANAFGSDWAQLLTLSQPSTLNSQPTGDPLNKERRFLPLRLDDAPIKGSLAQFLYINWRPADHEQEYRSHSMPAGSKRYRILVGKSRSATPCAAAIHLMPPLEMAGSHGV